MNTYLAQFIFTPTRANIDTTVSAKSRQDATRKGRQKVANMFKLSPKESKRDLRWRATWLISSQGRLEP